MAPSIRILLVEDNQTDVELVQELFAAEPDLTIEPASSLAEARRMLAAATYNCVLLDLCLPDSSDDPLQDVREIVEDARAPVMVLTGLNDRVLALGAIRNGAQDYLIKDGLSTDALVRSITYTVERWSLNQKIAEQSRLLDTLRRKQEFIALLTHDLKTPLVSFHRILDAIAAGTLGCPPPDMVHVLERVRVANRQLLDLVENAVTTYRLEEQPWLQEQSKVDLPILVEGVIDGIQPLLAEKSISVIRDLDRVSLSGDSRHLMRAVQNILDNAVKFTEQGGTISVSLKTTDKEIRLAVCDTGPGMAPEDLECIFQKFAQTASGSKYKASSGLGLYVTKLVMDAHRGHIEVSSEPGKGTTVTLVLREESCASPLPDHGDAQRDTLSGRVHS